MWGGGAVTVEVVLGTRCWGRGGAGEEVLEKGRCLGGGAGEEVLGKRRCSTWLSYRERRAWLFRAEVCEGEAR